MRQFNDAEEYEAYRKAAWAQYHRQVPRRLWMWAVLFNVLLLSLCVLLAAIVQSNDVRALQRQRYERAPGSVFAMEYWWRNHPSDFNRAGAYLSRTIPGGRMEVVYFERNSNGRYDLLQVVEIGWPMPILNGKRWMKDVDLIDDGGVVRPFRWRVIPVVPTWGVSHRIGLWRADSIRVFPIDGGSTTLRATAGCQAAHQKTQLPRMPV